MRVISGAGGSLHLVGEPTPFTDAMLEDAGDGFDWRPADAGKRLLADTRVRCEAWGEGGWEPLQPERVERLTGRVSLPRCCAGRQVRMSGICLPLARVAVGDRWQLRLAFALPEETLQSQPLSAQRAGAEAALYGWLADSFYLPFLSGASLLVSLPFAAGVIAAIGELSPLGLAAALQGRHDEPLAVVLDNREVHYALA